MKALVVSIHDVSPLTREAVERILGELARLGVWRTSLLVIPDHHHRGNITGDSAFAGWLREKVAAGHEPVVHGYYHQRERHAQESARTRFMTRFYTAGEGEFYDIGFEAARGLLVRGREQVAQCAGMAPAGFIAPAWLLSAEGEAAAREAGFVYTTRLKVFSNLVTRAVHPSQSLCWSVRAAWRRAASLAWNRSLFSRLSTNPLLRISIHPPDISHPAIWRQIQRIAGDALADREAVAYGDFASR